MMLGRRVVVTSLAIALPAAALVTTGVEWLRARDLRVSLDRVVRAQLNEQVRERCESDAGWFLTGPLIGRPPGGAAVDDDSGELPPRPRVEPQPFELFAYDDQMMGSSTAAPRLPQEFRLPLRADGVVEAPFRTDEGTGRQLAVATGWRGGPCAYLLGRMYPPPRQTMQRLALFSGVLATCFSVALLTAFGLVRRVRRLARDAHEAVEAGYSAIAPDRLRDELSSLTFVYNDMATELHGRRKEIEDQEKALRRFVQTTVEEVGAPLADLEAELGRIETAGPGAAPDRLRVVGARSHDLGMRVHNLAAAARLRMAAAAASIERVDLNALTSRVADRHMAMARASDVTLQVSTPSQNVFVRADESLLERALSNLVDNAIRYNEPGGTVTVVLRRDENPTRFTLRVTDSGRGVTDEQLKALTAIRRFRGDEGRTRRPGAPGLGLAIAREVADRFGLQLALQRPDAGGFEAVLSGPGET